MVILFPPYNLHRMAVEGEKIKIFFFKRPDSSQMHSGAVAEHPDGTKSIWHRCCAIASCILAKVHSALSLSHMQADSVLILAHLKSISAFVFSEKNTEHSARSCGQP
jgi:hypothetical protein